MDQIVAVNISSIDHIDFKNMVKWISVEKAKKVDKLSHFRDRVRILVGDLLIRHIICSEFGIDNEFIQYGYEPWGKPFLLGLRWIHFNISHSNDWVVCAIGTEEIGIDVEYVRNIDIRIADKFYSKEEKEYLYSFNGESKIGAFYSLWTKKESFIKAIGKGLSISLNTFSVTPFFEQSIVYNNNRKYFITSCQFDPDYRLAICSPNEDYTKQVTYKSIDSIINTFVLHS